MVPDHGGCSLLPEERSRSSAPPSGVWNGERILPAGWTDYVRSHGSPQPASGYGYGAAWWTFPKASGLPQDAIVAQGNRGQYVVVIPSRSMVIVRRGFDATGMAFDLTKFTTDLLGAFDKR